MWRKNKTTIGGATQKTAETVYHVDTRTFRVVEGGILYSLMGISTGNMKNGSPRSLVSGRKLLFFGAVRRSDAASGTVARVFS